MNNFNNKNYFGLGRARAFSTRAFESGFWTEPGLGGPGFENVKPDSPLENCDDRFYREDNIFITQHLEINLFIYFDKYIHVAVNSKN